MLDDLYIGLGANLPHPRFGPPKSTLEHVLTLFPDHGLRVLARSPWYESAPIPASDQPWYVNGVVRAATALSPSDVLSELQAIEAELGRQRVERNEARSVDLDIIAFGNMILNGPRPPIVPHPRMADRGFVLLPLADLAPDWRHPATGERISSLVARLPRDQVTRPLQETPGSGA
ncbi:2-amino-4-hydroxy-6-hydroxymethyldihydropteridine diphosphokinase [Dongia deserti]|uniref:2-amino-4-hydroxy-6- hydroxymethyldihydropteridine diphosphokinase n=1 Tax=Dongia deserti TaxID=2268030 RepID=UPI000E64943C|nr:2-amino-4-hydroxy-6-hydroxymethyldihydropteridine diphosphokinase [Dongia deserti]